MPRAALGAGVMQQPAPETLRVNSTRVACDGASDIPGGTALGHPRVFLEIDEKGYVDCGYCDRRFILIGGPVDGDANAH
jgi:NADH dehydrogenase (ubiquinone) Fe-S protein 6